MASRARKRSKRGELRKRIGISREKGTKKGTERLILREGEGENVTQTVLGLSARWIWHLEEQRPLTLRCGRAAIPVCYVCVYIYLYVYVLGSYIHTYITRERESVRVLQPFVHSLVQAGRSVHRRAHTRRGWIAYNYPLSDTEIYVRIPRAHVTNGRSASKEKDLEREGKRYLLNPKARRSMP